MGAGASAGAFDWIEVGGGAAGAVASGGDKGLEVQPAMTATKPAAAASNAWRILSKRFMWRLWSERMLFLPDDVLRRSELRRSLCPK
jgi:hypothetical protein